MAYFASRKAGRTGTDKRTRKSIAKGKVSPTYKHRTTGKEMLRGVVQLDLIKGRDVGYITGKTLRDRVRSAGASSKRSGNKARDSVKSPTKAYMVTAGNKAPDTINTSKKVGLNKKTILIAAVGIGAIAYLVMR